MDPPSLVDLEPGDLGAFVGLQELDTVDDGMVLDHADQKAYASRICVPAGPEGALEGQVVRLGATRGEDHLGRPGTHGLGNRLAGLLDDATSESARGVQRRRVADHRHLVGHRLDRLGQHRRGRTVVEVDKTGRLSGFRHS